MLSIVQWPQQGVEAEPSQVKRLATAATEEAAVIDPISMLGNPSERDDVDILLESAGNVQVSCRVLGPKGAVRIFLSLTKKLRYKSDGYVDPDPIIYSSLVMVILWEVIGACGWFVSFRKSQ